MSLKAYGEWLKKNLEVSSEEEIVRFMTEKRAAGCVEEPDKDVLEENSAISPSSSFSTINSQALSDQVADRP